MSRMRGVLFNCDVCEESVSELLEALRSEKLPGRVVVNSPGGTFEFFSVRGPALARTGFRAIGGNVASAAVILYLLGRVRYATPDATFFFHDVRTIVEPDLHITLCDVEEAVERARELEDQMDGAPREALQEWARQMRSAQSWMLSFMQQQTGISAGTFANLMHNEVTLSAREALRYGVVHRIITADQAEHDPAI